MYCFSQFAHSFTAHWLKIWRNYILCVWLWEQLKFIHSPSVTSCILVRLEVNEEQCEQGRIIHHRSDPSPSHIPPLIPAQVIQCSHTTYLSWQWNGAGEPAGNPCTQIIPWAHDQATHSGAVRTIFFWKLPMQYLKGFHMHLKIAICLPESGLLIIGLIMASIMPHPLNVGTMLRTLQNDIGISLYTIC